ncbi:DUF3896 family protein [Bacillus sp. JJ1533]|uniref:DUF3896 family protein n=1 Tax=Bacillus sp. JJ1533 TaxID=3122959 RepID=UPI0030003F0F
MKYKEVKEILYDTKQDLVIKMKDPDLTGEEIEKIQKFITNYDYIIELTDMNYFERGTINK